MTNADSDLQLSIDKWDTIYKDQFNSGHVQTDFDAYKKIYYKDTFDQVNSERHVKNATYLEIGCGTFSFGRLIANRCKLIIGVDISPEALKIAKIFFEKNKIHNYLLIQADILRMPIANDSVDLIYGGGVIEHFKDTQKCVNELYRVLRIGGVSFNTVPMLNIGSLTYRQIWGNIPNFPILKEMYEFIHIQVLRSRYMMMGYEFSFLPSTLRKIHKTAGFKKITIDRFRCKLLFEFIPKFMRNMSIKLANTSPLFWPMLKVVAVK